MKSLQQFIFLITLLLFSFSLRSGAQQVVLKQDSAHLLFDTALAFAKSNSIYRGKADWKKIEDTLSVMSVHASTVKDAIPAVKVLFELLGDHHGSLVYNDKYYGWKAPEAPLDTLSHQALLKRMKAPRTVKSQLLEKGYGYLLIPDNNPTHSGDHNRIAQQIQDSLSKLCPEELKGLVIDLRLNPGGSMSPMLGGVINLFKPGKLGAFIDPVTKKEQSWSVTEHVVFMGGDTSALVKQVGKALPDLKIVVLIGPRTASSGEAAAISFKGRKNTRFIGENTWGYTTANDSFQLSNTLGFFLATSVEADKNGHIYSDHVSPDELIIGGDNFNTLYADQKIIAALKWLKRN